MTLFTKIGLTKHYLILTKEQKFIHSNMASRSTVSLITFASKRCLLFCQQNLVVELYNGSTTDLEAFQKATMKLQTVKGRSSIKNLRI